MEKFWGDYRGRVGYCYFCAISLRRVKIEEKLLWGPVGSHQRFFDFLGRRHISTSGFTSMATETAVFALFLPVYCPAIDTMVQIDFLAANHVRIIGLYKSVKNAKAHRADIFAIAQLSCCTSHGHNQHATRRQTDRPFAAIVRI